MCNNTRQHGHRSPRRRSVEQVQACPARERERVPVPRPPKHRMGVKGIVLRSHSGRGRGAEARLSIPSKIPQTSTSRHKGKRLQGSRRHRTDGKHGISFDRTWQSENSPFICCGLSGQPGISGPAGTPAPQGRPLRPCVDPTQSRICPDPEMHMVVGTGAKGQTHGWSKGRAGS